VPVEQQSFARKPLNLLFNHSGWHQERRCKLIGLNLFNVNSLGCPGTTLANEVAPLNMNVLTGLKLVAKVKMTNFMSDGESLAIGMVRLVYANAGAVRIRDQYPRHPIAKVPYNEKKVEAPRDPFEVNRGSDKAKSLN
jgi:hypothetical protein